MFLYICIYIVQIKRKKKKKEKKKCRSECLESKGDHVNQFG
mgnify:CR=1 FL=1